MQDRRLDLLPFVLSDGSSAKMRTLAFPGSPFDLRTEKSIMVLVERSSDFLAFYSLTHAECGNGNFSRHYARDSE
jgi:hypothetical protein